MRRSQPASQDSEDADTVATADCSRWRPVSAPQPWWAMEPCESGRRSSTDGGRRVRTGDSLDGLSLAEQRERVDVIARRFRVYNDGRAPRPREHMPPADTRHS